MRELNFITLIMCSQDATYKHLHKDSTQNPEALKQPLAKPSLRCLSFLWHRTCLLLLFSTTSRVHTSVSFYILTQTRHADPSMLIPASKHV
jgi:hypothetical protein